MSIDSYDMKRISTQRKLKILALQHRRDRRRRRHARVLKELSLAHQRLSRKISEYRSIFSQSYGISLPKDERRLPIMLPQVISLRDNYDETVSAIAQLRNTTLINRLPAFVYFDRITHLEPAAALLLAAEIYRCRAIRSYRNGPIISGSYPKDIDVCLQLRDLGFFSLFEVADLPDLEGVSSREDRPHFLKFVSAKAVIAEFASGLTDAVTRGAFQMNAKAKRRMVGALKEAMGNSVEHAYQGADPAHCMHGRWWLSAYIDPAKREMMVIVLDQGVGIPRTLDPTWPERFAALRSLTGFSPTDAHMIMAATELHRSSTGQSGRGKGFRDMKRFVDQCDDGELLIVSNSGRYHYINGQEQIRDHLVSIEGTLIEWRVRHGASVETQDDEEDEIDINSA
ncbi:hypothetical protein ACO2RV_14540 [Ancylobacter sp. VNQ12]|uniref:hypothetical protein n=1 Tax=Ancylobacter sp. VNQ12 TaxID=3400920 RepID=UPI003C08BB59